jgi:RecB family exonuclease
MTLRLITGAANCGKTGEVLGAARRAVVSGVIPTVVVPTLAEARRFESEFSRDTPVGIRVLTWSQFLRDLWALHGDGRGIIGRHARDAVIAAIVADGVGAHLEPIALGPGLPRLLSRIVSASSGPFDKDTEDDGSAGAVRELLGRYRRALDSRGLLEATWAQQCLTQSALRLDGPVGLMRFETLALDQAQLLVGLAEHNAVDVALTWEAHFAPTRANDAAVELLERCASEHRRLSEPEPKGELDELSRSLYGGPRGITARGEVAVGLAAGAEAEAALIAEFVGEGIEGDIPAERVVVAFPDAALSLGVVDSAFRAAGVPFEFVGAIPLSRTPYGRAFLSMVAWAAGVGGQEQAMTYFTSPYSAISAADAHAWDREARRKRDRQRPTRSSAGLGNGGDRCAETAHRVCPQGLSAANVRAWQDLADSLLATAAAGGRRAGSERARADAAAHQAVSETLFEMAQVKDVRFRPAEILKALTGVRVRRGSQEPHGKVQVCSYADIGSRRFDVVVLGGLTEGQITTRARELPEDELGLGPWAEAMGASGDLTRAQFYGLVSRARRRLFLTRQDADSEGRELQASALWEDALDAYRLPSATDGRMPAVPVRRIARDEIEKSAPALTQGRRRARAAEASRFGDVVRSQVGAVQALEELARQRVYSATQVETYLRCPYQWFYESVVHPEEIDREFDARELGSLAHRLLAEFYRRLSAGGERPRVTPEWRADALALFDAVATELTADVAGSGSVSDALAVARATAWGRNVVDQDAEFLPGFVPAHAEMRFGADESFEFAGVAFRGHIDRVDVGSASVFVTDYKSSREVPGIARFAREGRVQAVLYALAAEAALGTPVSGSVYRSMTSGRLRGLWRSQLLGEVPRGMCEDDGISEVGFSELVSATEERVAEAVEGMRAGRVEAVPRVNGACSRCSIGAVCGGAQR